MTLVTLGHRVVGSGPVRVVVLNDWLCDTTTWDAAADYLDGARFTWVFADLRGYGRSRELRGEYTLVEAASDVVALADALGWTRFALVGHSMSTLVAIHVAQHHADRIERVVLVTPPPPNGFGADDAAVEQARGLAFGDPAKADAALRARFAERLSAGWAAFKVARWRASMTPEAFAGYAPMFMQLGVPDRTTRIKAPVLALTGDRDGAAMRRDAADAALRPLCTSLETIAIADAGHYPMQETPPLTVALLERFLGA